MSGLFRLLSIGARNLGSAQYAPSTVGETLRADRVRIAAAVPAHADILAGFTSAVAVAEVR